MKNLKALLAALATAMALTACGGSSNSSGSSSTPSTTTPATDTSTTPITAACAVSAGVASVTAQGCTAQTGNNTQTVACINNSLKMLTGTNVTLSQLSSSGNSIVGNVSLNGTTFKCA